MTDRLSAIIENTDEAELLNYLRGLSEDERAKLAPRVKQLAKDFHEFGPIGDSPGEPGGRRHGYTHGTHEQRHLIQLAAIVCCTRADFDKIPGSINILDRSVIDGILGWYCPPWYSDYVNSMATWEAAADYHVVMELTDRGLVRPTQELIIKTLPEAIFLKTERRNASYHPEFLLKREITLKEHFWWLFELESNLHYCDRWLRFGDIPADERGWVPLIKAFIAEGRLPRPRLLRESLLASNRNFNKILSGWFIDLFLALAPTDAELLGLQKELFSVLSSRWSKPANVALQSLKKISGEKDFDAAALLDTMPVLLTSDTKSIVTASITLLDGLAGRAPQWKGRIAVLACQCFIHTDEDVQSRAAKLIVKCGDPADAGLRQELRAYWQNMRSGARKMLAEFEGDAGGGTGSRSGVSEEGGIGGVAEGGRTASGVTVAEVADASANISRGAVSAGRADPAAGELQAIPIIRELDDLIFLLSQAFDNNESWHLDLIMAALVNWAPRLKAEDLPRLEPAFQRALKQTNIPWSEGGFLSMLLALAFIDFGNWLIRKFPAESAGIRKQYERFDQEAEGQKASFLVVPKDGYYVGSMPIPEKSSFNIPYQQLLLTMLIRIAEGNTLPLLSTPSHAPCWVAVDVLVARLLQYQKQKAEPDRMDLSVAISRCRIGEVAVAPGVAPSVASTVASAPTLEGELGELMRYLAGGGAIPKKRKYTPAWVVAAVVRKDAAGLASLEVPADQAGRWLGQSEWENRTETSQYIDGAYRRLRVAGRSGIRYDKEAEKPANGGAGLYELLRNQTSFYSPGDRKDTRRILSLAPINPESYLGDLVASTRSGDEFISEEDRRIVLDTVQWLYETWNRPGAMTYLFLATGVLSNDKTVAGVVGELWLKAVSSGTMDQELFGGIIGDLEATEYAPLKRLTELLTNQLFQVSAAHNSALQALIEAILVRLPDEPVKNTKKLLELYAELLVVNASRAGGEAVRAKLAGWQGNAGLKKLVGQVLG